MRKPIVGETLFSLNVGNDVSKYSPRKLTPVVVTKVGRKYFYTQTDGQYPRTVQFYLSNWREVTQYQPSLRLYGDPQEWEDDKTISKTIHSIEQLTRHPHKLLSLSQETLKEILDRLDPQ